MTCFTLTRKSSSIFLHSMGKNILKPTPKTHDKFIEGGDTDGLVLPAKGDDVDVPRDKDSEYP